MRITMDMDEVIADCMGPLLDIYNRRYSTCLIKEDIKEWGLPKEMIEIFSEEDFFLNLPPLEGAIEGMRSLKAAGHDVIIATSASGIPNAAKDKVTWIKIWLPEFLDDLCIIHRKDRLIGDLICDDRPLYLDQFSGPFKLLMDRPWNRNCRHTRITSWVDLLQVIKRLDDFYAISIGGRKAEARA